MEGRMTRMERFIFWMLASVFASTVSIIWVAIDIPGRVSAEVQGNTAEKLRAEFKNDFREILREYGRSN